MASPNKAKRLKEKVEANPEGFRGQLRGRLQNVTGTHVNYYFVCQTKLWFFAHHIQMEQESDLVALGKLTHEEHYARETKEISMPETNFLQESRFLTHPIHSGTSNTSVAPTWTRSRVERVKTTAFRG